ncbi:hypothetical protein FLO80_13065 [Aquicoccus porphyridii]|uniref:Uncharacterized protein n=1 Tax=Aquicoccus porphyridii TaxID=1852029 RepID=A0A5A9Z7U4_9RHOB|nr:hypothetical protein [Aquicoccus porphyridii]KAA0913218.1 hypothetical protein FLO80_13065 [Aquicoccus porphyridii]RAI52233.1 hypothetical protein DOO74_18365 [Rhodobacteraceae bacterium AsT-22]
MADRNALPCLAELKQCVEHEDIAIELLCAVDPMLFSKKLDVSIKSRAALRRHMEQLNKCIFDITAEIAIDELADSVANRAAALDLVIFYDGTPTRFHERNLQLVSDFQEFEFYYFGEKPIFTDVSSFDAFSSNPNILKPYYCDFIETRNPAVLAISKFIEETGFQISSADFWRAGSSGLKHLVGHTQSGVEGGAFLDKMPHDLSILNRLLSNDSIQSHILNDARILSLIPWKNRDSGEFELLAAQGGDTLSAQDIFLNFRDDVNGSRQTLPADGQLFADYSVRTASGRSVACTFLASWIGYCGYAGRKYEHPEETRFIERLNALNIDPESWIFSELFHGNDEQRNLSCRETQARIVILEGFIGDRMHLIVANLIHAEENKELDRLPIDRWVNIYELNEVGKVKSVKELPLKVAPTYAEQKKSDLKNVFREVIYDALGVEAAVGVGKEAVDIVHGMLLKAHDYAYLNADASDLLVDAKLEADHLAVRRAIIW